MFFFDDPLSALDVNVGNHVFHNGIKTYLKNRTRIVVTHNLGYLKHFDRIIFMDKGEIVYDGNYEDIKEKEFYRGKLENNFLYLYIYIKIFCLVIKIKK